jgi:hypothetical protein
VSVDLGAAVFQQAPEVLKRSPSSLRILARDGLGGGDQSRSLLPGILVKNENSKDVAKKHPDYNEGQTAENEQTASTHGHEGLSYVNQGRV